MALQHPFPGKWQLFRIWATIGLQSFGGGASTTLLIQQAFIEKYQWMTIEDFAHFWNLCILTPGINLLGLTILIGKKLGGIGGVAVSLAGLLLPSATATCLLAALFTQVEHTAAVQAILKGIIPATGAVMLLVGLNFALPLFRKGQKEGGIPLLLIYSLFIILCALAVIVLKLSAIIVVIGAILIGAFLFPAKAAPVVLPVEREEPK